MSINIGFLNKLDNGKFNLCVRKFMYNERLLTATRAVFKNRDYRHPFGFIGIVGFEQHHQLILFQKTCDCV